jgi:pyrroloquinoline quinone biosynthesis protein B
MRTSSTWIALRLVGLLLVLAAAPSRASESGWQLVVLGVAQDGGMPHPGCEKSPCKDAREGKRAAEKVSCIGLVNRDHDIAYMIDATPDFPAQMHALNGGKAPDAIFLTHAHVGHYTGLAYLGKEAMAAKRIPVWGTERMNTFLAENGPWSLLVENRYIELRTLVSGRTIEMAHELRITPLSVPHRDEFTDTVGFLIEGPRAKALFVPDIDKWEKWDRSIRDLANDVDVLLLDGTFATMDELPNRDIADVPHPLMSETRALLRGTSATLWFIHVNHSNPALEGRTDVAREGMRIDL